MQAEEILHIIAKPFILSGVHKDEKTALTDMTLEYVRRKIDQYDNNIIMSQLQKSSFPCKRESRNFCKILKRLDSHFRGNDKFFSF